MPSEWRRLYLPAELPGSFLESCTPKPFVIGEQCPSCRQGKLLEAVTPTQIKITDGSVDANGPLCKATLGGYYIREDLIDSYIAIKPEARLVAPRVAHRSLTPMLRYRRILEGSILELDEVRSKIAFYAICRTCGHVLSYLDRCFSDTIKQAIERLSRDPRYEVTECPSTELLFRVTRVRETGVHRWGTRYFLDEDVAKWAEELVGCDLRGDQIPAYMVVGE